MYITADRLDDLLRGVFRRLLRSKNRIYPSRGAAREEIGVLLQLSNPRARLSRVENRARLFSCLGELLWYLAASNKLKFIRYYIPRYAEASDDGRTIFGAYGPRLFKTKNRHNQLNQVIKILKKRPDSRRAVIQLYDAGDMVGEHKDVPCTCTMQFMVRGSALHMMVHMRSNDAFIGLPHDIFAFTMIQELVARSLGVEVGQYNHAVGSLHLYDVDDDAARRYLKGGWQSVIPMPPMPAEPPWTSVRKVLKAERVVRGRRGIDIRSWHLDGYWQDIIRLLQIFRYSQVATTTGPQNLRNRADARIAKIKTAMSSKAYDLYIEQRRRLFQKTPDDPKNHVRDGNQ
jgi:thymidylate synthase